MEGVGVGVSKTIDPDINTKYLTPLPGIKKNCRGVALEGGFKKSCGQIESKVFWC